MCCIFSGHWSIVMATPQQVLQLLSPVQPFLHQISCAKSQHQVRGLLSCLSKEKLILILMILQRIHKWKWILPTITKQNLRRYKSHVKDLPFSTLRHGTKATLLKTLQLRASCVKAFIKALLESPLGNLLHYWNVGVPLNDDNA